MLFYAEYYRVIKFLPTSIPTKFGTFLKYFFTLTN